MMNSFAKLSLAVSLLSLSVAPALAAPKVVATTKPIHSLVAAVMGDLGTPELLIKGGASPHSYSLKPSDAAALESADIVFWTGAGFEVFLEDSLGTLAIKADTVALADVPGLVTYPTREGGAFEEHDHGDHAHDEDEHEHEDGHDHDHDDEHEHEHGEGAFDMHFWLDPVNAEAMVGAIAETLSQADPDNAATYAENAASEVESLRALTAEIDATLTPVRDRPFVVFHDAFQYFEKRFDLTIAGSITVNPEVAPGAQRIDELRAKVGELGATCVFAEPQFQPTIISAIIEGSSAKSGVLDPEASLLTEGPELYQQLLRGIASSLVSCLSP